MTGIKKDFSVVFPVRDNIDGLLVTLGAFDLFTANKDAFEVVLVVDDDDTDLPDYQRISKRYGYDIKVLVVKRSDNFSQDYYNYGVSQASGENIMVFNDDCYMQTDKWDDKIRAKIAENGHFNGVYLVSLMDSTFNDTPKHPFPRFPMLSRKAIETVGFFFFPQVRMWPADKVVWDLYSAVGCVITCHEVKMQHDHNYNHDTDPRKNRLLRLLLEDKENGVFPVNANEEAKRLVKAIDEDALIRI
jgi:glycosyltransferase involved in cell wall biosynthesis